MARLYRPFTPLSVKIAVAQRQAGAIEFPPRMSKASQLAFLLRNLADRIGCDSTELRLDHDPALALRDRKGEGSKTIYTPAANDPEFLRYRPHGTQHADSHDVKTRIRGENGQLSDIALIKKRRRIERGPRPKRGPKIKSREFPKVKQHFPKRRKK